MLQQFINLMEHFDDVEALFDRFSDQDVFNVERNKSAASHLRLYYRAIDRTTLSEALAQHLRRAIIALELLEAVGVVVDECTKGETPEEGIARLAQHIQRNIPGEPSAPEGAIDCAIRLLSKPQPAMTDEQRRAYIAEINKAGKRHIVQEVKAGQVETLYIGKRPNMRVYKRTAENAACARDTEKS